MAHGKYANAWLLTVTLTLSIPSFENWNFSEILSLSPAQDKAMDQLPIELLPKSFIVELSLAARFPNR